MTADPAPTTRRSSPLASKSVQVIGLALVCAVFALISPGVLNDGDTYWHIRAGEWMLDHRAVLHTDPFSYSFAGKPWQTHEWLSEVLMALVWRAGGWAGEMVLVAACTALAFGVIAHKAARSLGPLRLILLVLISFGLIAPGLLVRPHLLALPCLALWTCGLLSARERNGSPSWFLLLIMPLWANLHGGYIFGVALIAPFALEALLAAAPAERRGVILRWGSFGIAAVAAALITPHGLTGLLFPFKLLGMKSLATVQEWMPSDFSKPSVLELFLVGLIPLGFAAGRKLTVVRVLLLAGLVFLTLSHRRHQLMLGVIAPLLIAPLFAEVTAPAEPRSRKTVWAIAGLAAFAILAAFRLSLPVVRTDDVATPKTALAAVPAGLRQTPVFNDYGYGGYLIFEGVKPIIDGRTDMYGDAFMNAYNRATAPDAKALAAMLDQYGVQWTILMPGNPAVAVLDASPGWKRMYADRYAVIHVRMNDNKVD